MEITKLIMAAIGLVTTRTREFQAKQEGAEPEPKLSEKGQKIQDILRDVKSKGPRRMKESLLKAFSVLLDENLSMPDDEDHKILVIPTHVLVGFKEEDPGPGDRGLDYALGSVMLEGEDDDELLPRIVDETGKWYYAESIKIEFPTDEEISTFIKGLPEKVLRREFHFLN